MKIIVGHKQWKQKKIDKVAPGATVIDVTSRAEMPWVKFSPFYPHGGIPVPFSDGLIGESVEGIWQGLKVFESADIDLDVMQNRTMKRLKRTERKFGKTLGHRQGMNGERLLDYLTARLEIYLPIYTYVLENRLQSEVELLKQMGEPAPIVLLDYETNCHLYDLSKPLSHAGLVKAYLEDGLESMVKNGWIGFVGNDWITGALNEIEQLYSHDDGAIGWDAQSTVTVVDFCNFYLLQRTEPTNPTKGLNLSFLSDPTLVNKLRHLLFRLWIDQTQFEELAQFCQSSAGEIMALWGGLQSLPGHVENGFPEQLPIFNGGI